MITSVQVVAALFLDVLALYFRVWSKGLDPNRQDESGYAELLGEASALSVCFQEIPRHLPIRIFLKNVRLSIDR